MKKYFFWILFIIIFLGSFIISLYLSWTDSATMDEKAHIPAGYSYIVKGDYRLNPEHPPLAKALSGISLYSSKSFWGGNDFFQNESWEKIDQWQAGEDFIFKSGNDADKLIFMARLPMVLIMLGLGVILFLWARELWGNWIGLIVSSLYLYSPTALAHGHLVTTDIPITFCFLLVMYSYWKFLSQENVQKPKKTKWLWLTGISLGILFLTKFSAIIILPMVFFILSFWAYWNKKHKAESFWKIFWRQIFQGLKIIGISALLVYIIYLPLSINYNIGKMHELINLSFPTTAAFFWRQILHGLANNFLTKPIAQFLIGFSMVFAHAGGGHTAFLLGNLSNKGWWYFFPIAFLLKTTLPVLVLFISSLFLIFIQKNKQKILAIMIFLISISFYFLISMISSLNLGIRHLLPIYPFIFLIIGYGIFKLWNFKNINFKIIIIILLSWHIIESLIVFPYYLSYFNQLSFTKEKREILIDSSLDWGQDLKRLKKHVNEKNIKDLKIDYFGGSYIPYYFNNQATEWNVEKGETTGWLAVCASRLTMADFPKEKSAKTYNWLKKYEPIDKIGDTFYIYYIPQNSEVE